MQKNNEEIEYKEVIEAPGLSIGKSMNWKIFIFQLVLLTSIIGAMSYFELMRWKSVSDSYVNKKVVTLAKTIEPHARKLIQEGDTEALQALAKSLTSGQIPDNDVISVLVLDDQHQKLAESSPQIIQSEQGFVYLPATVVANTEIKDLQGTQAVGNLRIVFSNRLFEVKSREVIRAGIEFFLFGLVLVIISTLYFSRTVIKPIKQLVSVARDLTRGNIEKLEDLPFTNNVDDQIKAFYKINLLLNKNLADFRNKNRILDGKVFELDALQQIGRSLSSLMETEKVYDAIVDHTVNFLGGVRVCNLFEVDEDKNHLLLKVSKGLEAIDTQSRHVQSFDEGIEGRVFASGEAVLFNQRIDNSAHESLPDADESYICVPIRDGNKINCILSIKNRISGTLFSDDDMRLTKGIAKEAGVAIKNAKTYKDLKKKILQLNTLHEVGKTLGVVLEIDKLLDLVMDLIVKVLGGVKTCSVILYDEETEALQVMLYKGKTGMEALQPIRIGEGIAGKVFQKGEPIIINDHMDSGVSAQGPAGNKNKTTRSSLCVPLKVKEKPIGVLSVSDKQTGDPFDEGDLEILVTLAHQIAATIYSAQLYEDLEASYLSAVRALANSLDAKDTYTRGHSERVARYSMEIGRVMNLTTDEIKTLHIGALLHDIGKIGISESIINKSSRLTDNEFETIKTHPSRGASIIEPAKFLKEKLPLIKYHHERFDGKGYPDGLKGTDIPMLARIICVADSYDAMTSKRAYRDTMPRVEARNELIRCSGSQFDPKVVTAFLEVLVDESKLEAIEKLGK